jgi:hypothetical protein
MKKIYSAALAATLLLTVGLPRAALAIVPPPPPPAIPKPGPIAGELGIGGVGGFISLVGFLVVYDLIRRTTCSGDFLGFGGPGFDSPITAGQNILAPPRCGRVLRVKG